MSAFTDAMTSVFDIGSGQPELLCGVVAGASIILGHLWLGTGRREHDRLETEARRIAAAPAPPSRDGPRPRETKTRRRPSQPESILFTTRAALVERYYRLPATAADPVSSPYDAERARSLVDDLRRQFPTLFPPQGTPLRSDADG